MAIKTAEGKYKCSFCNKVYSTSREADICRDSHDLVYIQMLKSDASRLLQFIITKNDSLITDTMLESIRKYAFYRPKGGKNVKK